MFDEHIRKITPKVSITIAALQRLENRLPRTSATTISASFVRSHSDYGKIQTLFDKAYNNSFQQRLKSLQYKALTSAINSFMTESAII